MPTRKSLDEAAKAAGYDNWTGAQTKSDPSTYVTQSIQAHASTLDQLHGRTEMSEAERLYRELGRVGRWLVSDDQTLDKDDKAAIALLEAALNGAKSEPEWIEWNGGECPVAPDTRIDFRFRMGVVHTNQRAGNWAWSHGRPLYSHDIVAYRVLND